MSKTSQSPDQQRVGGHEYVQMFAAIRSICNERQIILKWFLDQMAALRSHRQTFRFLSVGSGPGDFDLSLIRGLFKNGFGHIEYTAVEPSREHVEALQARCASENRIKLVVQNSGFDQAHIKGEYDLILFMHSLYYFEDKSLPIARACQHLVPSKGKLVLIHQASQGVSLIQNYFVSQLHLKNNPGMSSEFLLDVVDDLAANLGLSSEYSVVSTTIETTEVFSHLSDMAEIFFRFLLNVDPGHLGAKVLTDFREYVRGLSYKHRDRFYMLQPLGVFVIGKR